MSLGYNERAYQATFVNGGDSGKKNSFFLKLFSEVLFTFPRKVHKLLTCSLELDLVIRLIKI